MSAEVLILVNSVLELRRTFFSVKLKRTNENSKKCSLTVQIEYFGVIRGREEEVAAPQILTNEEAA